MNPVAESLTGWGERDAAGRPLEDVFVILNEDSRATVDNPARRALREGLIVGLANHTILIGRDGAERPIDDSAAPIRAADGTVLGCVLVFRDISERKAAERRIAMSEVRYRTLFELGPVAVYTCDQDGVIREYNRRAAELWGREPIPGDAGERFCGSVRMFTATGELMPHEHCPMAAVLSGELPLVDNGEVHIEQPDGTRVIVNVSIRPLHDEDGRVLGAINCFFDVTDRKQAEQAMARLAAIVTASNDAIISKDLTGRVTTWNAGAERLFGYTAAEAIGQPVTFLFPDGHEDEEEAILARLRRGEVVNYGYETVRRCKDGRHIHVSLTISPMFDADGRIIGAAKVARDISERVVLMQRIAQQSEAISEESRRKDEFLAMLSHELRNPLAPIRSAVHLLRAHEQPGAGSPLQAKALEIIDRQAANLTKLVSDLLEVSRVVSGHIRLEMQTVDLNQVVAHAVETAKPLFEQRGHGLFVRTLVEPVWVSADPTRLEEVFINLLNNAAKYTPDGGRIEVFCELTQPADKVRIRVRDNGIGIELGLLPRIFDLFTQSDRSLARSAGGLGVGLTLAHRLVEMQGGTIEAKSDGPGTGAEFTVTLVPVPRHAAPHQGVMFAPAPAAGLRILVVDDNLDLVTMLSGSLRHRGYEVREAYTGTDGLEIAKDWHPDVVLLDIGLPGLDGYEVATRIRGHASGRTGDQPRLVALTGYGRETDKQLAQEAGFDRHLTKPLDFEELAIVIAGLTKLPRP